MDWKIFSLIQNPAYQAVLFLLLTPILIVIIQPKSADMVWVVAVVMFALFLIVNTGLLWFDDRPWPYFFYSIGFAVGYAVLINLLVPALLKVLQVEGSGESAMGFLIILYQPFGLLLVMLIKWMVK